MDLSIIIVNFNTKKLVLDCISSIKKNTKKVKYEIIVVDNASTEKIPSSKDYKLIVNKENKGFAYANNQGIREAKGNYIFLLNSDTIVKEEAIDKLYYFAEKHEEVGVVVPQLLNTDGTTQASVFRLPTITNALGQYFLGRKGILDKYIPEGKEPIEVESAVMAAYLITPQALKKVGKLNEKYFMYFEDLDYSRSINESGLKIYYLPNAQIIHIHGASGGKNKYLIDSAKKYHGFVEYYIYTFILWLGQKWDRVFR